MATNSKLSEAKKIVDKAHKPHQVIAARSRNTAAKSRSLNVLDSLNVDICTLHRAPSNDTAFTTCALKINLDKNVTRLSKPLVSTSELQRYT